MSRFEEILQSIIDGGDPAELQPPQSRNEVLMQAVAQKMGGNAAQLAEISQTTAIWKAKADPMRHVKLKTMFGAALIGYWPLSDVESSVALDYSGNGRNGAYIGTVPHKPSPFGGMCAPLFAGDGTMGVDLHSSALAAACSGLEGSISFDLHCEAEPTFPDSLTRSLFWLYVNDNNRVVIRRGTDGTLSVIHCGAGTVKSVSVKSGASSAHVFRWSGMHHFTVTWSVSGGALCLYIDGVLVATESALGSFTGAINTILFGSDENGADGWNGYLANVCLLDRAMAAWEVRHEYASCTYNTPVVSIIGDSIEDESADWPVAFASLYNGGNCYVRSHAVAGNTIVDDMATQVTAALADNADIIIIALGTNDTLSGSEDIQAAIAAQAARLRASNDRAALYYMAPLPRWTTAEGTTPVNLSAVRTAIRAACEAAGVRYIDTHTDPWIAAPDTYDGLHPAESGVVKVATKMAAALPARF